MSDLSRDRAGRTAGRRVLYRALHFAVPVLLIALVLRYIGTGDVLGHLTAADPVLVLAGLLAAQVQIVACALRWRFTAGRLGAQIGTMRALGEYYLSGLINMTVPGGVVGDAARVVRTRAEGGFEVAAQAVVIERFAGQLSLGAVLFTGVLLSGSTALQLTALGVAGSLLCLVLLLRWVRPALLRRAIGRVGERFMEALKRSWFDRGAAAPQVALSLVVVAANLASFGFAAAATGTRLDLAEALFAVPMILAAMLIPFSIGGWGYREGAAAAVFPLIGASAAAGVGASLLFGALILVANLPGLLVLLTRPRQAPGEASG